MDLDSGVSVRVRLLAGMVDSFQVQDSESSVPMTVSSKQPKKKGKGKIIKPVSATIHDHWSLTDLVTESGQRVQCACSFSRSHCCASSPFQSDT